MSPRPTGCRCRWSVAPGRVPDGEAPDAPSTYAQLERVRARNCYGIWSAAIRSSGADTAKAQEFGLTARSRRSKWLAATTEGELKDWFEAAWGFAKQILPLLMFGVLVAGLLLGRVGHEGVIPSEWVSGLLGGNSLAANAFASAAGAFMYFATLTEVPIIQGLTGAGMGKGPALALLLAGPALSLPSILVISKVMGARKTFAFVSLIVVFSMFAGWVFGMFA